jgi:hypothetical protein
MTAARGGVGVRLYVEGGEVAKRTFKDIGDSGQKMWSEVALGQRNANPALRALSAASNEAQGAVHGLAGRAGVAGTALGAFGAAGVTTAAIIGGFVVALNQAREAMRFGAEITDAAEKINISTTALQEWRHVALEAGHDIGDAEQAIASFGAKLGEAMAGGRAIKWFERLGFDKGALEGFASVDQAMIAVIDRISNLSSEAERAAITDKLGLGSMTNAVRRGGDEIAALRREAVALGVVMDEDLIARADAADAEFDKLSRVVSVQLKSSFVDLAPVLVDLMGLMAELARTAADVADAFRAIEHRSARSLRARDESLASAQASLIEQYGSRAALDGELLWAPPGAGEVGLADGGQLFDRIQAKRERVHRQLAIYAAETPTDRPRTGRLEDTSGGGGRSSANREAQQREREQQRALSDFDRQEVAALREAARVRWGSIDTAEGRWAESQAILQLEQQQREASREELRLSLEKSGLMTDENRVRWDSLRLLDQELDERRQRDLELARAHGRRQEDFARTRIDTEDQLGELALRQAMTRNATDSFAIERRIIELERQLRRQEMHVAAMSDGMVDDDEQSALDAFDRDTARQMELVDFNEEERLRGMFKSFGMDLADAIIDGDLSDFFSSLGRRFLDRAFGDGLDMLFDAMGGGKKGGGGGWMSAVGSFVGSVFGGGKASGGEIKPGYHYRMAEHGAEVAVFGRNGTVMDHGTTMELFRELAGTQGAGAGAGRPAINVTANYSPSYSVTGSGPEIDRLRTEMERDRAAFKGQVIAAVNDGIERREIR